jgi:hypothetical protein
MNNPQNPQLPESLSIRVRPHGDPPSWLISRLSPEQLMQIYRLQLEFEKAVNVAQTKFLDGMSQLKM